MSGGRVDESILLVIEATSLDLRCLFLLIHDLKVLIYHNDLSLSHNGSECVVLVPVHGFDIIHGNFMQSLPGSDIIEDEAATILC